LKITSAGGSRSVWIGFRDGGGKKKNKTNPPAAHSKRFPPPLLRHLSRSQRPTAGSRLAGPDCLHAGHPQTPPSIFSRTFGRTFGPFETSFTYPETTGQKEKKEKKRGPRRQESSSDRKRRSRVSLRSFLLLRFLCLGEVFRFRLSGYISPGVVRVSPSLCFADVLLFCPFWLFFCVSVFVFFFVVLLCFFFSCRRPPLIYDGDRTRQKSSTSNFSPPGNSLPLLGATRGVETRTRLFLLYYKNLGAAGQVPRTKRHGFGPGDFRGATVHASRFALTFDAHRPPTPKPGLTCPNYRREMPCF